MFGKKPIPPAEQAKQWKASIRGEVRKIERQMNTIEREEGTIRQKIASLCRQGHEDAVMPLVKSVVQSRRARSQLLKTSTQLGSLIRQIDLQMAEVRVSGCFKQSTEIMHTLNQMMKLPEMQATVQQLATEMNRAGLAGEMIDDAMGEIGSGVDPEDEDLAARLVFNEIAKEVNKTARQPVTLLPVDPSEVEADPHAAAISAG
jgi:charged multivesicular body protein 3